MPSPIRVPIYERTHSDIASSDDEGGNDAIAAYLTPLLTKHDRGEPLVYEDLLESSEVAKAVAASSTNTKAKQELESMHESQLQAYEACARTDLTKLAEGRAYATIEEGESMPRYIERCVQAVKDDNQKFAGWQVSNDVMEEVFWSNIKAGARKAYFAFKSQSIEKDKREKLSEKVTGKVKAFEAAALGALVSKSESQDSEMAAEEEEEDVDVEENDMTDGNEGGDDDGEEEEEEEEDDNGEDDSEEEGEDIDAENGGYDDEADAADAAVAVADNGRDMPPVKTPMKTKKRRRLPNGPLGGGGSGTTSDGGKKQQPTKKQKTGNGANRSTNDGRGKAGTKSGKAGRGGGGGRGTRKRTRKKGTGAGAGGVA